MKQLQKRTGILFVMLLFAWLWTGSSVMAQEHNIEGRVLCEGQGVAGAVISDGEQVVVTDAAGAYTMHSSKQCGYVFLSIPSGYEVEADGIIPRHFVPVTRGKGLEQADFHLKKVDNSRYTLVVLNDIHLSNTAADEDIRQFWEKFVPDYREMMQTTEGKLYGLTVGDMTTDSRWYRNNYGLPEYLKEMERIPSIPLFHSMGNHDNDPKGKWTPEEWDSVAVKTYRRVVGPSYYSFNLGEVHYVMLDNLVYLGPRKVGKKTRWDFRVEIDKVQMEWLAKDLQYVDYSTPLVICMHAPMWKSGKLEAGDPVLTSAFTDEKNAYRLLSIVKKFKRVHFLTGHTHVNRHYNYSKRITEHNNIAVAASSWKLDGEGRRHLSKDGTPGGYAIYRVNGKQIEWSYKALGRPIDSCQFIVYDMNTVPEQYGGQVESNEVWINVYNYDPSWQIEVREQGSRLPVERIRKRDPLYRLVADGVFGSTSAFKPAVTDHMFRVVADHADSTLEITVRDSFGHSWTQTVERPKAFHWQMQ